MRLSIGQAWSETKDVIRRDGGLVMAVALALLVLPGTLVGLAAPANPAAPPSTGLAWLGFASGLMSLAGQLAISRIALGPPLTVGRAIGIGFTRLPMFIAATIIWVLLFVVAFGMLLAASGANFTDPAASMPTPNAAVGLIGLLLFGLFLFIAVRMLFTTPLSAGTHLGPLGIVKQSWNLSRGNFLKLLGLLIGLLVVAAVLVLGLGSAIGSVVLLLAGRPEPWNVSALLVALVQQLLGAILSVGFVLILTRCYAQVAGEARSTVSVPDAGGDHR